MNGLPEGIRGKILALGILGVLLATVYVAAVAPLLSLYDRGEVRLQERLELAQRLQKSAADLPRLRTIAAQWREKTRDGDLLLAASSDAVAGAKLQSTLKALVEKGGAKMNSAEMLPPETKDKFRKVGIRVAFSGNLALLTTVLRGIETSRPVIFVDNLDIRGAARAAAPGSDPAFTMALDVFAVRAL